MGYLFIDLLKISLFLLERECTQAGGEAEAESKSSNRPPAEHGALTWGSIS